MWNAECEMRNGCATVDSAFRTPHSALASVLNVALTGNIAAGKSTVVDLFRRWGATIIDADVLVREAQAPGGEVLAAIAGRFGADVLASDGTLDRAALRGKVMGDQAALDALNQIVHPACAVAAKSSCARPGRAATCSSGTTSRCSSRRSTRLSSMPWSWWMRAWRCGAPVCAPCAGSRTTRPTG